MRLSWKGRVIIIINNNIEKEQTNSKASIKKKIIKIEAKKDAIKEDSREKPVQAKNWQMNL